METKWKPKIVIFVLYSLERKKCQKNAKNANIYICIIFLLNNVLIIDSYKIILLSQNFLEHFRTFIEHL